MDKVKTPIGNLVAYYDHYEDYPGISICLQISDGVEVQLAVVEHTQGIPDRYEPGLRVLVWDGKEEDYVFCQNIKEEDLHEKC